MHRDVVLDTVVRASAWAADCYWAVHFEPVVVDCKRETIRGGSVVSRALTATALAADTVR